MHQLSQNLEPGSDSVTFSVGGIASGPNAFAEGASTQAYGAASHSEGNSTIARGQASHAEGYRTKVKADSRGGHAEGIFTIVTAPGQHVQGSANVEDEDQIYAHIVGNGSDEENRSNAYALDWDGNGWFAGNVYVGSVSGIDKDEGSKKLATEEFVTNKIAEATVGQNQLSYLQFIDGQTKLPAGDNWSSIAYGSNMYVAVRMNSNRAAFSKNGKTWKEAILPAVANWSAVAYGDGKFMAIAKGTQISAYSEDGINWVETSMPREGDWSHICFDDHMFYAVGVNSTYSAYYYNSEWRSINGKYIFEDGSCAIAGVTAKNCAVAIAIGNLLVYSHDGSSWTSMGVELPSLSAGKWVDLFYNDGYLVALSSSGTCAFIDATMFPNGTLQGTIQLDQTENWKAVVANPSTYDTIFLGASKVCRHDVEGMLKYVSLPSSSLYADIVYTGDQFVAIASDSPACYSKDGVTWSNEHTAFEQGGIDITDSVISFISSKLP